MRLLSDERELFVVMLSKMAGDLWCPKVVSQLTS